VAKTKNKDNAETLRQLDMNELNGKLISARKALFELKLKRSEQKNPLKIKWTRHSVARILTIIKEKTGGTAEKSK
jgi:ribosomal protein L29